MPREDLEWVVLSDFSPGIRDRVASVTNTAGSANPPSPNRVLGVASRYQADGSDGGTWGCMALKAGGLAPLPRRITADDFTPSSFPTVNDTLQDVGGLMPIAGFWIAHPIDVGKEFHIFYDFLTDTPEGVGAWWREDVDTGDDECVEIWESRQTATLRTVNQARPCWFQNHRSIATIFGDITQPGTPLVVAGWFMGGGNDGASANEDWRLWATYPNATDPGEYTAESGGTVTPYHMDIDDDTNIGTSGRPRVALMVEHQARNLIAAQGQYVHGKDSTDTNTYLWTANEQLYATGANGIGVNPDPTVLGAEQAQNYGLLVANSYSELLIVKQDGGGLVVRNAFDFPTVISVPGIPGTGNYLQGGVVTPIGVCYYSRGAGFWAWNGGESGEDIGEHIDGDKYVFLPQYQGSDDTASTAFLDFIGRAWLWYEYVVWPGGWLYNWKDRSWWRLYDPDDATIPYPLIHMGPTVLQKDLWCGVAHIDPAGSAAEQKVAFKWDYTLPATDYRWSSQPLPIGQHRDMQLRQLVVVASGEGTITINLKGLDASETAGPTAVTNESFTIDAPDYAQIFRRNVSMDFHHITITVDSADNDGGEGAPVLHEIRFGMQSRRGYRVE